MSYGNDSKQSKTRSASADRVSADYVLQCLNPQR